MKQAEILSCPQDLEVVLRSGYGFNKIKFEPKLRQWFEVFETGGRRRISVDTIRARIKRMRSAKFFRKAILSYDRSI